MRLDFQVCPFFGGIVRLFYQISCFLWSDFKVRQCICVMWFNWRRPGRLLSNLGPPSRSSTRLQEPMAKSRKRAKCARNEVGETLWASPSKMRWRARHISPVRQKTHTSLSASAQGKSLPNMCNLAHFRTVCRSAELCNASHLRTSESDCKHGRAE